MRTKKRKSVLRNKIFALAVFGIGFIIITLVWSLTLITTINYVEVDAIVSNIEKVDESTSDHFDYYYNVTFKYTYNNKEYFGNKVYENENNIPQNATKVKCNPDNPAELANYSLLWISIIVSAILAIINYFLFRDLINYIKNRDKKEDV